MWGGQGGGGGEEDFQDSNVNDRKISGSSERS